MLKEYSGVIRKLAVSAILGAALLLFNPQPAMADDCASNCLDCVISFIGCAQCEAAGCNSWGINCARVCWICSGGSGCS